MSDVINHNEISDEEKSSRKKKWLPVIIAGVVVVGLITYGSVDSYSQQKVEEARIQAEIKAAEEEEAMQADVQSSNDYYLMKMQPNLIERFGTAPDNYIWDMDGSLLSLGDKSMSAEDVVYAYFNGLAALDFSTAQKYSRGSVVVSRYSGYFDASNKTTNYEDNFIRNMYRLCLLSMQPKEIINTSVFAENKQVFTVRVSMLDLTQKEFWVDDKIDIYKNLKVYNSDQADKTRGDMYLYDYINRYYESENAVRRDVVFDITLQKYPDLDTGWLVSIDTDVDLACRYADGTLVINYIRTQFNTEGREVLDSLNEDKDISSK